MADERGAAGLEIDPGAGTFPDECLFPVCDHVEHIKQEWESTVDALPQLVCLLDATGGLIRCNRTVERWGLGSVAEVGGRCLHDVMHPHCTLPACYLKQFIVEAYAGLKHATEVHGQADDPVLGRHLDLKFRTHYRRGADGAARPDSFAVVVVEDITELRKAELGLQSLTRELEQRVVARTAQLDAANRQLRKEARERETAQAALQQSRDKYQQLVETMSEGLAIKDKQGRISYVNPRLTRMLGYAEDELIGRPVEDFIDESCREKWEAQMALRRQGDLRPYELVLKGNRGRRIWSRISPNQILDRNSEYAGSIAVITDISDRMKAEQALRESENELRLLSAQVLTAQEKERQRIASELHDGIGQTLSAIKFYVENTLAQLGSPPMQHDPTPWGCLIPKLQAAIEEVRRISMDLRPSILDDLGILATLGWFCREYQLVYRGIRVELRAEAGEADIPAPLKVVIFRIVQEALNNVAKHARTDVVQIGLKKTGDAIELDIADNGIGFEPAEIAAKRGTGAGGTGLVSMRERSEYSGGRFTLKSIKGQGTCVRIVWPQAAEPQAPPRRCGKRRATAP
jgi:PAS domain S-box-containing protein